MDYIPLCERSQKKFRFLEMSELVFIFAGEKNSRTSLALSNMPSATTLRGLTGDLT